MNTKSLVLPVKNFINDSYCRDISGKVKSHQRTKREQGKFIGAFAVYGYRKSAEDKYKLCPDDYAAEIVRKIFAWKREGMSTQAIAQRLNELGILSPLEYKNPLVKSFNGIPYQFNGKMVGCGRKKNIDERNIYRSYGSGKM